MIQLKTMLNCIDNSGATLVECVANMRMKRAAKIGDRIIVVVQKARPVDTSAASSGPSASAASKVKRGDIRHAVVVRTASRGQRTGAGGGMAVRFDDNACVLVARGSGEPIGTRVMGVVGRELGGKRWSKILSLAPAFV